jgi:hypothetical protein
MNLAGLFSEVLETIESPDVIYRGDSGELLAAKEAPNDKYIVVVYKEVGDEDGFVVTAFLTRRIRQLERRTKVWARQR